MRQLKNQQTTRSFISRTALFIVALILTQFVVISNAFAVCRICLHGYGCGLQPGSCSDKVAVDLLKTHSGSCQNKLVTNTSNPNNYLLYDKTAAKAWLVEGTEKTPIDGPMSPDALSRWSRDTGLRIEPANRTKK